MWGRWGKGGKGVEEEKGSEGNCVATTGERSRTRMRNRKGECKGEAKVGEEEDGGDRMGENGEWERRAHRDTG